MYPLLGISSPSSSSPACFQPCPGERGHIQDHKQSNAHLHLAGGSHGKILEGCPPRRVVQSQPLTCPKSPQGGPTPSTSLRSASSEPGALPHHAYAGLGSPLTGSAPHNAPDAAKEKDAVKAAWLLAKVLKEIIACIKIFTPAKGLKTFP